MAKLTGGLMGFLTLIYTLYLILSGWQHASLGLKIVSVTLMGAATTLVLGVVLAAARIWTMRGYRKISGAKTVNEYAFLDDSPKGIQRFLRFNTWILPLWIGSGTALFVALERAA